MRNEFLELTQEGLIEDRAELYATRGFEIYDDRKEKVILIIGLNPAGGQDVADLERNVQRTHLYSIPGISNNVGSAWLYNPYFKPIFEFAQDICGDVKWPWCNKSFDELADEIQNSEFSSEFIKIKKEYDNRKNNKHTIYIGDMFYYHETKSKKLPLKKGADYQDYCKKMLQLHIKTLQENKKEVEFVYINNAQVSHWLCDKGDKTFDVIYNVKVFYGPMLSGQRAIDSFSRKRLIEEIKRQIR